MDDKTNYNIHEEYMRRRANYWTPLRKKEVLEQSIEVLGEYFGFIPSLSDRMFLRQEMIQILAELPLIENYHWRPQVCEEIIARFMDRYHHVADAGAIAEALFRGNGTREIERKVNERRDWIITRRF